MPIPVSYTHLGDGRDALLTGKRIGAVGRDGNTTNLSLRMGGIEQQHTVAVLAEGSQCAGGVGISAASAAGAAVAITVGQVIDLNADAVPVFRALQKE